MKVIVVGDSLLNGINEMGLCKKHDVNVKNVLGGTTVLEKIDTLVVVRNQIVSYCTVTRMTSLRVPTH